MKIGFLILAHKNPDQLIRLTDLLLSNEHITVFIHVDKKANATYQKIEAHYKGNVRIILLKKRFNVFWGSYGQILATLELMRESLKYPTLEYCCLISGQDLPNQKLSELSNYLSLNNGKEFLSYQKLPVEQWIDGGYSRLTHFYFDSALYPRLSSKITGVTVRLQKLFGYKRRIRYELYGGANWFNLSKMAIQYCCEFIDNNPAYLKQFQYTRCADEIFIQTILLNSPFRDKIINDDLRLVDWATGPEYPRIYRLNDLERITKNKDKFIARKFDEAIDTDIIDQLIAYNKK